MTIVYKTARSIEGIRVVLTLEVPPDALTNFDRETVAVRETAKYRVSKARVMKIEDENGYEYSEAISSIYPQASLHYKLNEMVEVDDYDTQLNNVCSTGIHVFLSREIAVVYNSPLIQNGVYTLWHDNGRKYVEFAVKDGNCDGLYQKWYDNGQKHIEFMVIDNHQQGLYQEWYENGQKSVEYMSKDSKKHGLYQEWYENGQKSVEFMMKENICEGRYIRWYKNGQKYSESTFRDGRRRGPYSLYLKGWKT